MYSVGTYYTYLPLKKINFARGKIVSTQDFLLQVTFSSSYLYSKLFRVKNTS